MLNGFWLKEFKMGHSELFVTV